MIFVLLALGLVSVLTLAYACLCAAGQEDEQMERHFNEHMK